MTSIFPDKNTKIFSSTSVEHPYLKKHLWSINSSMDFIFHTHPNDPKPEVIIIFPNTIYDPIYLYNRNGKKDVAEKIIGLKVQISSDGEQYHDLPIDAYTDEHIYHGKAILIKNKLGIKCIKLLKENSLHPIHLKQITIGKTLDELNTICRQKTKEFANLYKMGFDETEGYIIEKVNILDRSNAKGSLKLTSYSKNPKNISCIHLKRFGKFSNNLIQISHVTHIAKELNVKKIYINDDFILNNIFDNKDKIYLDEYGVSIIPTEPNFINEDLILEGVFFYRVFFQELLKNFQSCYHIIDKIKQNIIGTNNTTSFASNEMVIHIRSGDIFSSGNIHPGYGQPPLVFYKAAITHAQPKMIHLVFEDFGNPVILELKKYLFSEKIKYESHSSENLRDDINIIVKAKTVVAGFGTFIPGVLLLSNNIEKIYSFNKKINTLGKNIDQIVITDTKGIYTNTILKNNWRNSNEQRELMIEYPVENLAVIKN